MRSSAIRALRAAAMLWVAGGFAVATLVSGCGSTPAATPSSTLPGPPPKMGLTVFAPGQRVRVAEIAGPTLAGPRFSLTALRGHVVVINVWASWCQQCDTESPLLAALADRLGPQGVRFVGIDERDLARNGRASAARAGTDYPQLIDPYGTLLAKLPTLPDSVIPSTLVVDAQGRAAARVVGEVHPRRLARVVRRLDRDS